MIKTHNPVFRPALTLEPVSKKAGKRKSPTVSGEAFPFLTPGLAQQNFHSINDLDAEKVQFQVEADAPVAVSSETMRPAAV